MPSTLEVLFAPAEYALMQERDLRQTVCVVFDILRATSTMLTALGLGTGEAAQWHWSKEGLFAMAYLTLLSSCLAYTAFAWLARNTTPALVGTYSYVNPAIAAVLGWWFLGEKLGPNQLAGKVVIFAGVALVSWPKKDVRRLDEDAQKDPSTAGCG